jgi:hypothetical protein
VNQSYAASESGALGTALPVRPATPVTSTLPVTTGSSSAGTPTPVRSSSSGSMSKRVQAGMNINSWDVADDIERLVQSPRPANVDDLANLGIPLASLL